MAGKVDRQGPRLMMTVSNQISITERHIIFSDPVREEIGINPLHFVDMLNCTTKAEFNHQFHHLASVHQNDGGAV